MESVKLADEKDLSQARLASAIHASRMLPRNDCSPRIAGSERH